MRETRVSLPELGLVAGTRVALGVGLGFLLADRLNADQRRAVGWTLLLAGALTTIPLAFEILGKPRLSGIGGRPEEWESRVRSGSDGRMGKQAVAAGI